MGSVILNQENCDEIKLSVLFLRMLLLIMIRHTGPFSMLASVLISDTGL